MNRETRIRHWSRALCPWVLVMATHGCAPVATRLPSNIGTVYSGDPTPLPQSRRQCQFVANMEAGVHVSGLVNGRQVRRDLSIGTNFGVQARFDSFGDSSRPGFVLWAEEDLSRLYFPESEQLIESSTPEPLIEAVLGIPLTLRDLSQLTMGCPHFDSQGQAFQPRNGWLRVLDERDQLYLYRGSDTRPWSLVAIDHHVVQSPFGWRARFLEQRPDNMPVQVRITSLEWNGVEATRFDLRFVFRDIQRNPPQPFEDNGDSVALTATPTAVESVRHHWPLIAVRSIRQDEGRQ